MLEPVLADPAVRKLVQACQGQGRLQAMEAAVARLFLVV